MIKILEAIFKGLLQWVYELILEIVEYIANNLLDVFSMDLAYFESAIPVADEILNIIIATGWALLLGNLVFQAAKSMMSGLGFEAEDPKTLFARTFVFGFCLLASRQICNIGLGMSNTIITLLKIPDSVSVNVPGESFFTIGASWLLVIVVGFVMMWQLIKLFFAVGERYVLVGLLTILAPWAFATGGSRNTSDIFKGWVRMYGSMCLMMILNVVLLKMMLSAMGNMPSGAGIVPWLIFIVAITRVARKIDTVIIRLGLNPAPTGGQGRGIPGMLSYMVVRNVASSVMSSAGKGAAGSSASPSGGGTQRSSGFSNAGRHNTSNRNASHSASSNHSANNASASHSASNTNTSQQATAGAAGTASEHANTVTQPSSSGAAGTAHTAHTAANAPVNSASAGRQPSGASATVSGSSPGAAGKGAAASSMNSVLSSQQSGTSHLSSQTSANSISSKQSPASGRSDSSRRSSVTKTSNARSSAFSAGAAAIPGASARPGAGAAPGVAGKPPVNSQSSETIHPPIPRYGSGNIERNPAPGAAPAMPNGSSMPAQPSRYSSFPSNANGVSSRSTTTGAAGIPSNPNVRHGGANVNARNQVNANTNQNNALNESLSTSNRESPVQQGQNAQTIAHGPANPSSPGAAGTRKTSIPPDRPKGAAGTGAPAPSATPASAAAPPPVATTTSAATPASTGAAGPETRRTPQPAPNPAAKPLAETSRGGRDTAPASQNTRATSGSTAPAYQDSSQHRKSSVPESARQPSPGVAGRRVQPAHTPYPVTKPAMTGTRQASSASQQSKRIGKISGITRKTKGKRGKKNRKGKGI